jgi:hypothetical protein
MHPRELAGKSRERVVIYAGKPNISMENTTSKIQAMHNTVMVGEKRVNRKRFVLPNLPVELSFPNE